MDKFDMKVGTLFTSKKLNAKGEPYKFVVTGKEGACWILLRLTEDGTPDRKAIAKHRVSDRYINKYYQLLNENTGSKLPLY